MKKRTAAIFDLDGTLLDTLEDLADSANDVLAEYDFPTHPMDAYRFFVGEGAAILIRRILPEGSRDDPALVDEVLEAFKERYGLYWDKKTQIYDGVESLLDELTSRDIRMAILSNKPDIFTQKCVAAYLGRWTFDPILGNRQDVPRKPNPAGVRRILDGWDLPASEILYVGDTATDMKTAKAADLWAVGVTWGFRPREELVQAGADMTIDHPSELLAMVDGCGSG